MELESVVEGFDPDNGYDPEVYFDGETIIQVVFPEFPIDWLINEGLIDESGEGMIELMEEHSGICLGACEREDREAFLFTDGSESRFHAVVEALYKIADLNQQKG